MKALERVKLFRRSPLAFIEFVWGLKPERDNAKFIRGKHITWQQHDILLSVERALASEAPKRISVVKGHGVGGSTIEAWLIFWWLFCFKDSQVGCTAPSSEQMYDVLWKECAKWHQLMPVGIKELFLWEASHIRIKENPQVWFARAKTARKEAPEALAGLHGKYVMIIGDEASGIAEEIYNTAEGSLTDKNILVVLISNGTRGVGYFYDTHNRDRHNWQAMSFNSLESPLVDYSYIERIKEKHGEDSDEYRIRVLGMFPKGEEMDEKGYVQLFHERDLRYITEYDFLSGFRRKRLGVDVAGAGKDKTVWVVRDAFAMEKVGSERISTPKSVAEKTITLMMQYSLGIKDVFFDGFGEGAKAANEIVLENDFGLERPNLVMLGDPASDDLYLNLRAEAAFRFRNWCAEGGQIVHKDIWENELRLIRFKRNLRGKVQLMEKEMMRKVLGSSPDTFDAALMTFTTPDERVEGNTAVRVQKATRSKRTYGRVE